MYHLNISYDAADMANSLNSVGWVIGRKSSLQMLFFKISHTFTWSNLYWEQCWKKLADLLEVGSRKLLIVAM